MRVIKVCRYGPLRVRIGYDAQRDVMLGFSNLVWEKLPLFDGKFRVGALFWTCTQFGPCAVIRFGKPKLLDEEHRILIGTSKGNHD